METMLSVIVPVYNAEKYIDKCIYSILSQSYSDIELILVDDGSKDNSYHIISELELKDQRIKVLKQNNFGPSIARQEGIKIAQGKYITFVDADDFIEEKMYEEMIGRLKSEKADIIECGYNIVNKDKVQKKYEMKPEILLNSEHCCLHYARKKNTTSYLVNKMYRKDLFNNIEFPKYKLGEDSCILVQLYKKCEKKIIIKDSFYNYVMTPGSLCRDEFSSKKLDALKANIYIYNYYEQIYPHIADYYKTQICANAVQFYYKLEQSHLNNKEKLKKEMKAYFDTFYDFRVLIKLIKYIPIKRYILLNLFKINLELCILIIKKIKVFD